MAQFHGSVQGNRGEATRIGDKKSGLRVRAAGWKGVITTHVWHDKASNRDMFEVILGEWHGSGGQPQVIASGILDSRIDEPFVPALIA